MKWARHSFLVAALAILGIWFWSMLFPGPEKLIRARLARTARLTSFGAKQGALSRMSSLSEFGGCFSPEAEVELEVSSFGQLTLNGRGEIMRYGEMSRATPGELKVEFLDVDVMLSADRQSATATLTARVTVPGDRDSTVQGMKFWLKKIVKDWLIIRVETVKTLADINRQALANHCLNS